MDFFTWGTHFGETKLVASTICSPEETSIFINSTFTAVGTISFSFCNPSLGPTSHIFTNPGMVPSNWKHIKLLTVTEEESIIEKFDSKIQHDLVW